MLYARFWHDPKVRRLTIIALPLLLAACAQPALSPEVEPAAEPSPPTPAGGMLGGGDDIAVPETVASGAFTEDGKTAITYDPRIVPVGATAQVTMGLTAGGISVRLAVTGMLPRRTYGAHLHTRPCTADPAAAGPHYQHERSPAAPASAPASASAPPSASASASAPPPDPAYVNPKNEVWLDFTADGDGAATATAVQAWMFDELTPPRSVIVHLTRTRTEPGMAGTAGERLACLTLPG